MDFEPGYRRSGPGWVKRRTKKENQEKGQTRIRVVLLCWMKKIQQSRKLKKDRQLYSLGTRIVEERRTGEGKVEEGVGIALLSCLECSTVREGREKGVLATVANIVLGVWENILFPL